MSSQTPPTVAERRLPVGAEIQPEGGVHFRVWAPDWEEIQLVIEGGGNGEHSSVPLTREDGGYFAREVAGAGPGTLYRFRLGSEGDIYPDPASRFQPQGPFGPSQVVDPSTFRWTDSAWPGLRRENQALYEMHVGTFTPEGTWEAARRQLPALADLGITALEMLPVVEFAGRFGWGYDGVNLFAPYHVYGTPDAMRAFVDEAHRLGIGVLLDVVYHGYNFASFLPKFTQSYVSAKYRTEWGVAANFDDRDSPEVRRYLLGNVRYWIEEFHLDGFRIDATQSYYDTSSRHIIAEIGQAARDAAGSRQVLLVGESEPQFAHLARPVESGGHGLDTLWNDDFHHAAKVRLTGRTEAYFTDYRGTPEEFIAAAKWGFLYQGQWYRWHKNGRGTPALDLPGAAFVNYLQNHDQVANTGLGQRLHELTSAARLRAMTAFWLLLPGTPLLFQGQEFAASTPFLYFADNSGEQRKRVAAGRAKFLAQFPSLAQADIQQRLPDPGDPRTFERSKLDPSEREKHAEILALHRDLLTMRRDDPVFAAQNAKAIDGAALGPDAFLLRYFGGKNGDRLLLVNFGRDLGLGPIPQPLLAPPAGRQWRMAWSSEDPKYGGFGNPFHEFTDRWILHGECTAVLTSQS